MRYFYTPHEDHRVLKGVIYIHKSQNLICPRSTLYLKEGVGLEVVQKRFDEKKKLFYFSFLDRPLANDILEHENFEEVFFSMAKEMTDGRYPIVEARKLMWALRMKPLKKDIWEYYF